VVLLLLKCSSGSPFLPSRSAVTRNSSEKVINSILEHVSSSSNMELLQASPNALSTFNLVVVQMPALPSLQ
jgi:hypothetical protein